jgi:signal transduction histidine kinase/ubiquinone/menaquinone biosynthesis C-methylase UbiE
MFIYINKCSILFKAIALAIVCLFLVNDIAFGISIPSSELNKAVLAPPLATKPPCEIVQKSDGSYDVVTNNNVIESWDRETARSYGQGLAASGKDFRNRWAFVDVGYLIGQMLILTREHKLQNPKDILIPLIKKHIRNRDGKAEILLEGYDIDGIEEVREGEAITGFSLPVTRSGKTAYRLFYNLQSGETTIQMRDGKNIYVKTIHCTPSASEAEHKYDESFGLKVLRLYEEGFFDNPSERTAKFVRLNTWEPPDLVRFLEDTISRVCSDRIPGARNIAHPEKAGGTHFGTILLPDINLVYKILNSSQIEESVMLAYQRLKGIVLGFTVMRKSNGKLWVVQESAPSLKAVLENKVAEGDIDGAVVLIKKYFSVNIELFKRGVVNWDVSLQNYGVRQNGNVCLLDIGGLITTEEFLSDAEQEYEDSYLSYFWIKLHQDIPQGLRGFNEIADKMGFSNGGTIYKLVKKYANQEKGRIERFVPPIFRKELADVITSETKKRLHDMQSKTQAESEQTHATNLQGEDMNIPMRDATSIHVRIEGTASEKLALGTQTVSTSGSGGVTYGEFAQAPWYKKANIFLAKIAGVKPGERVLDVGAGTGASTAILLKAMVYKGEIIALDPNSEYLKIAAESLRGSPVRFVSGRAEEAKDRIKDMAPVDRAFMMNTIHLVDDPRKAFSDIYELLIPDGIIALNTAFFSENSSDMPRMIKRVLLKLARKAKQAGIADDIFAGHKPMTIRSIEEYVRLLQDAGFDIVEIKRKSVNIDFASIKHFYRDAAVTSYIAPSLRTEEREALIISSLNEVIEELRSKGRSYVEGEWLNIVARKKTNAIPIVTEQKIDKRSIADIFPQNDYLIELIPFMVGGVYNLSKESEETGKKLSFLYQRLNKGFYEFRSMTEDGALIFSVNARNFYLWFIQLINENLEAAKELLPLIQRPSTKQIMTEGVSDAENFVNGIEMLFDESMKEVDINDTLEKILNLTFARYYKDRKYKYVINKQLSSYIPTISARQDEIAYLFFSLVLPLRSMIEVALTVSTRLTSDKGRNYIALTIETPQEISLKNVIEEGKDTGVGFELAQRIVQKYGGTIYVQSPSAELGAGELGKGTTFTIQLPVVSEPSFPRSLGAAAFSKSADRIKQQLKDWHDEYMRVITEARQKWLDAHPENLGQKMIRMSLCLPKNMLQELNEVNMDITAKPEEGEVTVIKDDNRYKVPSDEPIDVRHFTQAEKITLLASLPKLPSGERSMEGPEARIRKSFSWWRDGMEDFELLTDQSSTVTAEVSAEQLEAASMYLSQKDGMIYVKQFVINPGFRLTGLASKFLQRALRELIINDTVQPKAIRFDYLAEGAREFLEYLEMTGFIVGPLVDKEGEYWLLGKEVTDRDIALAYDRLTEKNPFLKASEKLIQAMAPPARDKTLEKAFDCVREAVDVTMRAADISQYCLYIPYVDEFGEYKFPEEAPEEGNLPHIQWVTSCGAGVALRSRHIAPRPLTGDKWIFERLARGELVAGAINDLTGDLAHFDNSLGIWYIRNRRALIKLLLEKERFKYSVPQEEIAIMDRDYDEIGPVANTITYQSIYAPTLKEKDRPRLLGILWFIGESNAFQVDAMKSLALQSGYALERMYLLHSLEARKREIESADARLGQIKQIVDKIKNLDMAFHDLKTRMVATGGFYRRLAEKNKIAGPDAAREYSTIVKRVESVMNTLRDSQFKIEESLGHLPPAAPSRSILNLSNVNLAAALIQASDQQLNNVYGYYLGTALPTPEERNLMQKAFESLNSLSELRTLTGNLEDAYGQTGGLFAEIMVHLHAILSEVQEYAKLPLDEIKRLSRDSNEDEKTHAAARIILEEVGKIPNAINRLNEILRDVVTVEEFKEVSLQQLVAEVLNEVKSECEAQGIILEPKLPLISKPIRIRTKPDALKNYVIMELMHNAIKYMPGDKEVKKIKVWAGFEQGNVLLYIEDTGRGMSEEFIRTHLFELGAREDLAGADISQISRSGVGLHSARQLMRDIGGDLYVDMSRTAAGKGSTFVVKHPLITPAPDAPKNSDDDTAIKTKNTESLSLSTNTPQVIKDIREALVKKGIDNQGILTIEGLAGSGKNYIGNLIKQYGIGSFASSEIAIMDTDDYLPKMANGNVAKMLACEDGDFFNMAASCQFNKFEKDLKSLAQKHRLVVVVGLFTPLFFQTPYLPIPDIRVLLKNADEMNRMRVIRRDGHPDNYIASIAQVEELQRLSKAPFDVVVTSSETELSGRQLIQHNPTRFGFVLPKIYGKVVDEIAWEIMPDTPFEILSSDIESKAKSVLESKVDLSSHQLSDVEAVIAGTFSVIRHLFSKGEQSLIITVRTYEKGLEVIVDGKKEQILSAKEILAEQSLLSPLRAHIPEIVITTSNYWYGRTFYKRWKKDWVGREGNRYAFAIPNCLHEEHSLWRRIKERDSGTRPSLKPTPSEESPRNSNNNIGTKSVPQLTLDEHQDYASMKSSVAPETERIHATNLQDTIKYIQAQPQSQPLIVALGTSWIKGYEKGRYLQYDALNPLIGSIRTYCESKGIPFIVDVDDELLARINAERAKEGRAGAKVVVLAGENTVKSEEFAPLRNDEKNAVVVGVNNQELTTDSYIRLMEMLTLAMKLSAGLEISLDNAHITITKDNERHLYIFLPHAEPMDYERLKVIYEVQKFA